MSHSVDTQLDVLFSGNAYAAAVAHGFIRQGDALRWAEVFTATQRDALRYLDSHPIPGIDCRVSSYQDLTDGPKWRHEDGKYIIGWLERGFFEPQTSASSEQEFRTKWAAFLVQLLGLAA